MNIMWIEPVGRIRIPVPAGGSGRASRPRRRSHGVAARRHRSHAVPAPSILSDMYRPAISVLRCVGCDGRMIAVPTVCARQRKVEPAPVFRLIRPGLAVRASNAVDDFQRPEPDEKDVHEAGQANGEDAE